MIWVISDSAFPFFSSGEKWYKHDLTYRIINWPRYLEQHRVRLAVKTAFELWSNASPLVFREVMDGPADIRLAFYQGEHNDGIGNAFDGPGADCCLIVRFIFNMQSLVQSTFRCRTQSTKTTGEARAGLLCTDLAATSRHQRGSRGDWLGCCLGWSVSILRRDWIYFPWKGRGWEGDAIASYTIMRGMNKVDIWKPFSVGIEGHTSEGKQEGRKGVNNNPSR